jgi:chromosome segregation ATPase
MRESDIKLQEAIGNFTNRDSEAKSLVEKLNILEDQIKVYEEQVAAAAEKYASLKEELDNSLTKLASSESTNDELQKQILEAENKASQSFSENELLVGTNVQLKSKIDELQELLNSALSEKEAATGELVSHKSTIEELTEKHSRALDLHSAAEARILESETKLQEANQRFSERYLEAKDLNEKLIVLEAQIKTYEEEAQESPEVSKTRKAELEEALLKLKQLESVVEELQTKSAHFEEESRKLAEANVKLTEDVCTYESKVSDLEAKLSAAIVEKDETVEKLQTSQKTIEELTQQLSSEGQKLQSRVCNQPFLYSILFCGY